VKRIKDRQEHARKMRLVTNIFWISFLTFNQLIHFIRGFSISTPYRSIRILDRSSNFHLDCSSSSETDEDADFAAMQLEIAAMISSETESKGILPAVDSVVEPSGNGKYNKLTAIASAVLGSFFYLFQHSQPVSAVGLMHVMEKESADVQVCHSSFICYIKSYECESVTAVYSSAWYSHE
jgi:hypothetical protein